MKPSSKEIILAKIVTRADVIGIQKREGGQIMMNTRQAALLTIFLLMLLLSACAVKYVPLNASGGYTEEKTSDDTYVVKFSGNHHNTLDQIRIYMAFRAAEIALENGYSHFMVEEDASYVEYDSELSDKDLKIETRTSLSGGVQTQVQTTLGADEYIRGVNGVFKIKLMQGAHPVHKTASVDAAQFIEANRGSIKR